MADVTTFQLRYRVQGTALWIMYGPSITGLQETISGLLPNTIYELEVVATNSQGSVVSKAVTFTTAGLVPAAPGKPTASLVTNTSLVLNWGASPFGSPPINYQVLMRVSGVGSYTSVGGPITDTSLLITGMTPNTVYDFQVVATNSGGGVTSPTTTIATASVGIAPTAPSGLQLVDVATSNSVSIGWVGSTGSVPITYQVRYRVSGAISYLPFGSPISGSSVVITGLQPATTYDIVVDAINSVSTTSSTIFNATTAILFVPPSAPSTLTASNITPNAMTMSWGASVSGVPAPLYQLQFRISGTGGFANFGAPISGLTVNVTGLVPNAVYQFQVTASNSAGSATSQILTQATSVPPSTPSAPTGLTSTATSSSSVTLAWVAPTTGNTPFTYRVQSSPSGSGNWTDRATGLSVLTFLASALLPSTLYDFRVFASNVSAGEGPTSTVYTVSTTSAPATVPGAVNSLAPGVVGTTSVGLTWLVPSTGTPPFTYTMQYRVHSNTTPGPWLTFGTSLALNGTVTGLTPSTSYDFQVFATNTVGPGIPSNAILSVLTSGVVPGQVIGVSTGGATGTSVQVTWQTPTGASVTNYQVQYKAHTSATWLNAPTWLESVNGTTILPGLGAIIDQLGNSFIISVAGVIAINGIPDTVTSGVTLVKYWGHKVYQENNLNAWYLYGGVPGSYTNSTDPALTIASDTSFTQAVTGLVASTSYDFRVFATNASGNGPVSAVATFSTTTPSAGFHIAGGKVLKSDGSTFISHGMNIFDDAIFRVPVTLIQQLYSGFNLIRLCCGGDQSSGFKTAQPNSVIIPWVTSVTAAGIVVVIEDHLAAQGANAWTGADLTAECAWYASFATTFKNNPLVWFGSENEVGGDVSGQHLAYYTAIRQTGNNTICTMCTPGGNPADPNNASVYNNMFNAVIEIHWYNWMTGGSTDQNFCNNTLINNIQARQAFTHSLDGVMPVWLGETGNIDYVNNDGNDDGLNGTDQVSIAGMTVGRQFGMGDAQFVWDDPWNFISSLCNKNTGNTRTRYGSLVAQYMNSVP